MPGLPIGRHWIIAAALAALFLGGLGGGFLLGHFWRPAAGPPVQSIRYRERLSQFPVLPAAPVVMLGDSITRDGEWAELLGPGVANRGISGDTSDGLLARLDASLTPQARTVFLMIGTNDTVPAARTAANTAAIVARLKGRRIYVQSLFMTRSALANARLRQINAANCDLCASGACVYVQVSGDSLGPQDSLGGLHLTGAAYKRWADAIRPLLKGT